MAVDTVRLRSPYVSNDLADRIEAECTKRMAVDMRTGVLLYEITTGDLLGSFDSRISIKVNRKEWTSEKRKGSVRGKVHTTLSDCPPFVEIEASVHKLFLGHNVYGGTEDFRKACVYLIQFVEELLGIEMPGKHAIGGYARTWTVKRIDFSYVFNLGSMEAIQQFFYLMRNSYYPRRSVSTYGLSGLQFNASTSVIKFYHKGPEFKKHDFNKLRRAGVFTESQLFEMLILATEILRVEVEIKTRKLKYDFQKTRYGSEPFIWDITPEYLQGVYETEINRVMKEGKKKTEIVRDSLDVEGRLKSMYSVARANVLFSAYLKMINFGVEKYKASVPKATYYRHMKELREAGVSVSLNNEVNLEDVSGVEGSLLPADFQPLRDDPRRMGGEDGQINMLIEGMNSRQKKDFRVATEAVEDAAIS